MLGITAGPRSGQRSAPGMKGRESGKVGEGGMGNVKWEMGNMKCGMWEWEKEPRIWSLGNKTNRL